MATIYNSINNKPYSNGSYFINLLNLTQPSYFINKNNLHIFLFFTKLNTLSHSESIHACVK